MKDGYESDAEIRSRGAAYFKPEAMKPSFHAREQLGGFWDRAYIARERVLAWIDRNWIWISALLILALYIMVAHFDRIAEEAERGQSRYSQIEGVQKSLAVELDRRSWCDPAYYIIEARSPRDASDKLLRLTGHIGGERIELLHQSDVEKR